MKPPRETAKMSFRCPGAGECETLQRQCPKLLVGLVLLACLGLSAAPLLGAASDDQEEHPKIDVLDRFDNEQSPLQRGMLDARDKNWSKNLKLGPDPRCRRVVRKFAKGDTDPKLCRDLDLDRTDCLIQYCGEENLTCAQALTTGEGIEGACMPAAGGALTAAEVTGALECALELFEDRGAGSKNRVQECLEDPFRNDCEPSDPECAPELKPNCKQVFKQCSEVPLLRKSEKKAAHSGVITDGQGKVVGKRIQTTTVIQYDDVKQRGKAGEAWDAIKIRGSRSETERHGIPGLPLPAGADVDALARHRVLGASAFHAECDPLFLCPQNDDQDCFDSATGTHHKQCFSSPENRLPTTLQLSSCPSESSFSVCCRHKVSGRMFYGDDCLVDPDGEPVPENLRTTLVQLIDEDPPNDELNNDGDCLNAGAVTSDCLDGNGELREGYTWNVDEEPCDGSNADNDCMGEGGRIGTVQGGQCKDWDGDVIGSTFGEDYIELVDEDCADDIDNDEDGDKGEDGPGIPGALASFDMASRDAQACEAYYDLVGEEARVDLEAEYDESSGCDLTRAMRVHVNSKLKKLKEAGDAKFHNFNKKTKKEKLFDVDDRGYWCGDPEAEACPDPEDPDLKEKRGVVHRDNGHNPRGSKPDRSYKYEEQQVTVDEVFAVKCRPVKDENTQEWLATSYDEETGNCVTENGPSAETVFAVLAEDPECLSDECHQAMMGFTFAPPVLEWGWRIQEQACVFGICFEIFFARVGYEFDLAAGIRLPIEIQFDEVPKSVLATDEFEIVTRLQPLDFGASQYTAFCELYDLDAPWYIANCGDRFAFPDFLDSTDGDEFVAQYSIFAGLIVRLLSIPVINWGIDSGVNVPAMCTAWKMKEGIEGMSLADSLMLALGIFDPDRDVLEVLKDNFGNCGSFTTPWGYKPCDPEDLECPGNEPYKRLRAWPFLSFSKSIRADCLEAMVRGEVITIKGKKRPICTGLTVGTQGASLGVGLTVEAHAGSELITADWSTAGDAAPVSPTELEYSETRGGPPTQPTISVIADNYANGPTDHQDDALVLLEDFTYYLNAIEIALSANLEFGGILSPIPDIASFTLFTFAFSTGKFGIPIPQHPGTGALTVEVPVENYALETDVRPDPALVAQPGCELEVSGSGEPCPDYGVWISNLGSVTDSFDNFGYELSNQQAIADCQLRFGIDPNNDHDCLINGERYRGDPFDGEPDDCYDSCGELRAPATSDANEDGPGCPDPGADNQCSAEESDEDGDGFVDEDGPGDDWTAAWIQGDQNVFAPTVDNIPAHSEATQPVTFRVSPFQHPFTSPGRYPFRVTADSVGAKSQTPPLPARGPGEVEEGQWFYRIGAPDIGRVEVQTFFDPRIQVLPDAAAVTPGASQPYRVEATNGSNTPDSMDSLTEFHDFNLAGCNLATLGSDPEGCPYRGVPTVIPASWIVGELPDHFPTDDPEALMQPLVYDSSDFAIQIPSDWEGLENTTYRFEVTATSTQDPGVPKASNSFVAEHTVTATFESMTRYIGLEIEALVGEIEAANAAGVNTAGLLPIATHPIRLAKDRALLRLLDGNTAGAVRALKVCIRTTDAFLRALEGSGSNLPPAYGSDWRQRALAIIADLNVAVERGSGG